MDSVLCNIFVKREKFPYKCVLIPLVRKLLSRLFGKSVSSSFFFFPNRLQSPLISKYTLKLWQLTSFNWTWEGLCSSSHPHLFLITREGVRKIKSVLQLVRKSEVGAAWVMTPPYSFIMGKLVVLAAFSLNWPVPYFTVCRKCALKGENGVD